MAKHLTQTYPVQSTRRTQIGYVLLFMCVMASVWYAVNLYGVIEKTVALKQIEGQTASISNAVGGLDANYLTLSGTVTPDALKAYGLAPGSVSEFISRTPSLGNSVALGGHEL